MTTPRDRTKPKTEPPSHSQKAQAAQQFQEHLKRLHEISITLSQAHTLDMFCRQVIALGREKFGFDRLSLWLIGDDPDRLIGTYGTDGLGRICDEHAFTMRSSEASRREIFHDKPVGTLAEWPLCDASGQVYGHGWHMMAAVRDGERVVGVLNADNLLNHQPLQEHQAELLGLYGATVGHLCSRLRAELALRDREQQIVAVIESVPIILFALDADGVITFLEGREQTKAALQAQEVVGQSIFEVYNNEEPEMSYVRRALAGEEIEFEYILTSNKRSYRTRLVPLRDHEQTSSGALGVTFDITERKHLEDQLRQAQKMEGIGQLAGGIAHDFNNLLSAVLGYAELARLDVSPGSPLDENLARIEQAAERAAGLTRQLLAFARRQRIAPRVVDIGALLSDLAPLLRRLISENIELNLVLHGEKLYVRADAGQLEQVVINLVINARDAMPDGGTLTLEAQAITQEPVSALQEPLSLAAERYVLLSVCDTGVGIAEEVRERIFEPFFTTKVAGKGTGLGLATVYGILQQNGGRIEVSSEAGEGATFRVYLPITAEETEEATHAPSAEAVLPRGTETLLVAEDEPLLRQLAVQTLRGLGYTVLEAQHGSEALALAEAYSDPIALLVTDVIMPQMGGRELAERLRAPRPETAVLFVSGYSGEDSTTKHPMLPGDELLEKPFTPATLARKVRETLDNRKHA